LRVLFLGGTSFTGPHAVRTLATRGHEITVFHRGDHEPDLPAPVRHVHGDLTRWDEHVDELRALAPDVVVDMVAYVAADGRRVLDFRGVAQRAVVVSSIDVYRAFGRARRTEPGPLEPVPLGEDSPLREVVVDETYDKVAVEREAGSDADYPVSILRYPAVHGPGDPQHRVYGFVRRMDDGRPAILLGETQAVWRWARGYTEDVGHALVLVVEAAEHAGRAYHVSWPVARELADWVRRLAEVVGWEGRVVVVPDATLPEALRFEDVDFRQHYDLDTSRIRDELGYGEVVDERTALERTIEWERANPPEGFEIDYDAEDAVLASLD
jgi:nucleoside-diphosphate-sugar epimerase